jgi:two-component system phosphate regulon response regulator PhoB
MNQKTVFIVEDDTDIQDVISLILQDNGYDVNIYGTMIAFKRGMSLGHPDVIVLDIRLPDGNGIEMCNELKIDPVTSHIPIILMSANKQERQNTTCAEAFISKPFNIKVFQDKVESFLQN